MIYPQKRFTGSRFGFCFTRRKGVVGYHHDSVQCKPLYQFKGLDADIFESDVSLVYLNRQDGSAGIEVEPHLLGLQVVGIDEDIDQDFQVGDIICGIRGISLARKPEDFGVQTLGAQMADDLPLTILPASIFQKIQRLREGLKAHKSEMAEKLQEVKEHSRLADFITGATINRVLKPKEKAKRMRATRLIQDEQAFEMDNQLVHKQAEKWKQLKNWNANGRGGYTERMLQAKDCPPESKTATKRRKTEE